MLMYWYRRLFVNATLEVERIHVHGAFDRATHPHIVHEGHALSSVRQPLVSPLPMRDTQYYYDTTEHTRHKGGKHKYIKCAEASMLLSFGQDVLWDQVVSLQNMALVS